MYIELGSENVAPTDALLVSVCICVYNAEERLLETLQHLAKQTGLSPRQWELVVVDNNSTDATSSIVRNYADTVPFDVVLYTEQQQGKLFALKRGINAVRGEIVVVVDDDNWLASDWLENCVALFDEMPGLGLLGGKILPVFENATVVPACWNEIKWMLAIHDDVTGTFRVGGRGEGRECEVYGAGMACRASVLRDVLANENLLLLGRCGKQVLFSSGGEDNEMAYHIVHRGWEAWLSDRLVLDHWIPKSRLEPSYLKKLCMGAAASRVVVAALFDGGKYPRGMPDSAKRCWWAALVLARSTKLLWRRDLLSRLALVGCFGTLWGSLVQMRASIQIAIFGRRTGGQKINKVVCVVYKGWREGKSGVSTFLRVVHEHWVAKFACVFAEYPTRSVRYSAPSSGGSGSLPKARLSPGVMLALGYIRDCLREIKSALKIFDQLRGRTIVVNQFGCETRPIALRVVFPFARIIAIAHTHPGCCISAYSRVRCAVEHLCVASVSSVVFNSHAMREEWCKKLNVESIRGRVIWHGVSEIENVVPMGYPERKDGVVDFFYLGRFYSWKGQCEFIEAFAKAHEMSSAAIRLIFAGDGDCFEKARDLAKTLLPPDSVCFLGHQVNGSRFFNGADVAVLMSIEPEAFGYVLIEAMSCGKPVLASRLGGIQEVVVHEETGVLVDPLDKDTVASAICRLAESSELRHQFGASGRTRWERHFTRERMLAEYDDLFSSLE